MQGIYKISCSQENKVYIGSSVNITRRWMEHRRDLNKGIHHCSLLQEAWDAYGDESFSFDIVELCENIVLAEQQWLDKHNSYCYNSSLQAHNPMSNAAVAAKQVATLRNSGKRGKQVLTEEQVVLIKEYLRDEVMTVSELANEFSVSGETIAAIRRGYRWSSVKVEGFTEGKQPKSVDHKAKIKELYEAGVPVASIAAQLKLKSTSSIYYALSKTAPAE